MGKTGLWRQARRKRGKRVRERRWAELPFMRGCYVANDAVRTLEQVRVWCEYWQAHPARRQASTMPEC